MTTKEMLVKSLENMYSDADKISDPENRVIAYANVVVNCIEILKAGIDIETDIKPVEKPTKTIAKTKAAKAEPVAEVEPEPVEQASDRVVSGTVQEPAKSVETTEVEPAEPATTHKPIDPSTFTEVWTPDAFTYFADELSYIQSVADQFVDSGNKTALITMLKAASDGKVKESGDITPLNVRLIYDYLSAQLGQ